MQFFFKDGDEKLAEGATHMDDIDMIQSPIDGALVVVAMKHGQHVCQICGGPFDEEDPRYRSQEVKMGGTRMLLHGRCHARHSRAGQNLFQICWDRFRGMQVRRSLAQAARQSQAVADAAGEKKIIA
jgi:hypothetical protein